MNILVRTAAGRVVARPDTTWKRGNEDYYAPDFVDTLTGAPVVFCRICKPGRSVSAKFADRYFDSVGCGLLLYPENLVDGSEEGFACACCLDRTTFLTYPELPVDTLGTDFELKVDGQPFFDGPAGSRDLFRSVIEEVSRFCYIRTGDYIAVELSTRKPVCDKATGCVEVKGSFAGNDTLNFKLFV